MNEMIKTPEFLFESSWEVCNKVGGIYTVLSTKAHTLQQIFNDKVIFIGPDVWANTTAPDFTEDASLFEDWRKHAEAVLLELFSIAILLGSSTFNAHLMYWIFSENKSNT